MNGGRESLIKRVPVGGGGTVENNGPDKEVKTPNTFLEFLKSTQNAKNFGSISTAPPRRVGGVEHDTKRLCLICAFCT